MPKQDFNLDDLKKSWQEQQVPQVYESTEIEAMLNKKSRNYVKYILWISLAEFLFFAALNVYAIFFTPQNKSFIDLLEKLGVTVTGSIELSFQRLYLFLKGFSLAITAIFVLVFYNNYKKIRIELNLKKFISQIIRFQRTVKLFILTNIFVLIGFTLAFTVFTVQILWLQHISLTSPVLLVFVVGVLLSMLLGVLLILLYYRVFYGIIMKRLNEKLRELQKIEQERDE